MRHKIDCMCGTLTGILAACPRIAVLLTQLSQFFPYSDFADLRGKSLHPHKGRIPGNRPTSCKHVRDAYRYPGRIYNKLL